MRGPLAVPHMHKEREVVAAEPDGDPMTIVKWLEITTRGYSLFFPELWMPHSTFPTH